MRNRYFTTIAVSSVKTVAHRCRVAANHNKHWRWGIGSTDIDDLERLWTPK